MPAWRGAWQPSSMASAIATAQEVSPGSGTQSASPDGRGPMVTSIPASRERCLYLDTLPSALNVISLTGADGKPLYESVAYETSRGCPYTCSFCSFGKLPWRTLQERYALEYGTNVVEMHVDAIKPGAPSVHPEIADNVAMVLADFEAGRFALLRADWTRRDPAITAALAQLGRNGVPVYAIYRPGRPPVVLSEILGVQEVRAALSSPL